MKFDFGASGVSANLRVAWDKLSRVPGGTRIFSAFVGKLAPYSGTIGAVVEQLGAGHARVVLKDQRRVRNHLNSIHAVALINLAELTSGLAMMYGIPDDARGILRGFQIDYLKKARGTLTASCQFQPPKTNSKQDAQVDVEIRNEHDEVVAKAKALWRIGPV